MGLISLATRGQNAQGIMRQMSGQDTGFSVDTDLNPAQFETQRNQILNIGDRAPTESVVAAEKQKAAQAQIGQKLYADLLKHREVQLQASVEAQKAELSFRVAAVKQSQNLHTAQHQAVRQIAATAYDVGMTNAETSGILKGYQLGRARAASAM